ncbi:MAG: hypothetical protein EHM57_04105 [Actinobacteria bacterium]|nr:MAG: hypothetical protein EHM57_04105 [Actinomycetota bacterium]
MPTTFEQMNHVLRGLVSNTPDLQGAAAVSMDGLILASVLPAGTDEDRVSAMAAALLSLGERTAQELQRGTLEQVYVKGDQGYIILMQAGGEAVLEGIAGGSAKLGMVLLAVWLIASAAISLLGLMIPASGIILAILAVISGILLLIGR